MNGHFLTKQFDFDGGRDVTAYVPLAKPEAIVFCGDGELIVPWGAHSAVPAAIVGIHRTSAPDEMVRLGEYFPGIEPERFLAHQRFFLAEVMPWAQREVDLDLPASRTAVAGVSASAEFALAMGVRHPDLFGTIFAASPGAGYKPPQNLARPLPKFHLTAGTEEPFFLENTHLWRDALMQANAQMVMTECSGEHGGPFWQSEFLAMLDRSFRFRGDAPR